MATPSTPGGECPAKRATRIASGGFVVGSYLLAEHFKDRRAAAPRGRTAASAVR